ncbi:MAG: hypothetical protein H0U97_21305 [Gammaproteobacteria bacterium]|nr:hypothetical protein [Gammaproteobacteria bacterium]
MSDTDPSQLAKLLADVASSWAGPAAVGGAGPFHQQLLYERWLRRPVWRLREEAVPLLLGIDPVVWARGGKAPGSTEVQDRVWAAVHAAVMDRGGPRVIDSGAGPDDWCVEPADLCRWASGRGLVLPESFVTLMDFILRAVKAPAGAVAVAGTPSETHLASVREQVLGAALNVLAKCPDQCYDAHGLCSGARIAERIAAQSMRWFDAPEPPVAGPEMTALIDRWLE